MTMFDKYAEYYDPLYVAKDYEGECDFLERVFAKYSERPVQTILDLGCGTGSHSVRLADRGYSVLGVDLSGPMLVIAREKAAGRNLPIHFVQGDIRTTRANRHMDAAIAMFAVLSYMTKDADFQAVLQTARVHLLPGGLLIFDVWYGPGVLIHPPTDRYRIAEIHGVRFVRLASSEVDTFRHCVNVHYKIVVARKEQLVEECAETHTMRYWFPQELIHHLKLAAFEPVCISRLMEFDQRPTEDDWTCSVIARAV